jgi:hypothetical protein
MTLKIQMTTYAWRTRLNFKLTWDSSRFELKAAGPFCCVVVRIYSDQTELPYSLP